MQKQVIYILQANLLLAALAGTYLFLKTIPTGTVDRDVNFVDIADTISNNRAVPAKIEQGKTLFMSKCASCHSMNMNVDLTGPALAGFEERGPWADREKLYEWIKNPSAFLQKDKYTSDLQKQYRSTMTAFPNLAKDEIDAIVNYINHRASNTPVH